MLQSRVNRANHRGRACDRVELQSMRSAALYVPPGTTGFVPATLPELKVWAE